MGGEYENKTKVGFGFHVMLSLPIKKLPSIYWLLSANYLMNGVNTKNYESSSPRHYEYMVQSDNWENFSLMTGLRYKRKMSQSTFVFLNSQIGMNYIKSPTLSFYYVG